MEILHHISELSGLLANGESVGLTLGNFDGVHAGHRMLLEEARRECLSKKLRFAVMTFLPHPRCVLSTGDGKFLIDTYEERRELLRELGVEFLIEVAFTKQFSTIGPKGFLDNHLILHGDGPRLAKIFLGHDFSFGANKQGDFQFMKDYCSRHHIEVTAQDGFVLGGAIVSSSRIREKILGGKMEAAALLLGRHFSIHGLVVKSAGRGKKIGFPTANILFDEGKIVPGMGVYITETISGGTLYQSLTNVGSNPTFESGPKLHVETHILDFDQDIYGQNIKVLFHSKIRDEMKFSSVDALVKQIRADVETARSHFSLKNA